MTLSERIELIEMAMDGVTPGRWEVWEEQTPTKAEAIAEMAYQVENSEPFVEVVYLLNAGGKCPATTGCGPTSAANAAYIAACNPVAISELLAAARKAEALQQEVAEKDARIAALEAALDRAPDGRLFDVIAEAMAEVKATSDGQSDQSIEEIVVGCLAEIGALSPRRARTLLNGGSDAQG